MLRVSLFLTFGLLCSCVDAIAVPKCSTTKPGHPRPSLDEVKASFYKAKIVPELLPVFAPTSLLYLTYKSDSLKDTEVVLPGKKFAKDTTENQPEISIEGPGWPGAYVFFLLDPDAPSHSNPKWAQVRHMFAGNLTVSGRSKHVPNSVVLTNATTAVNEYMPPAPPAGTGPHRYVALLYAQPLDFDFSFLNTTDRYDFNITEFSRRSGLGTPLAGTFMTVKVKKDGDVNWLMHLDYLRESWPQIGFNLL